MVSVQTAKDLIAKHSKPLPPVILPLHKAAGLTLAQDIFAPISIPSFAQSAMDGYAFCSADFASPKPVTVYGEIQAGSQEAISLLPQTAMRIFTGAPIPQGSDTVVMQEKVILQNNQLIIQDNDLKKGSNIKQVGSEIKQGELALHKGALLTPAAIGLLASMGIAQVLVYPKPSVFIIITGEEIIQPGKLLQYGQVYDANSFAIHAALEQLHIATVEIVYSTDHLHDLQNTMQKALQCADIVLMSGGISTGDYDFSREAMRRRTVNEVFYKVAQKPGKPLCFGTQDNKLVFALPGNPSAALICLYEYVLPAMERLSVMKKIIKIVHLPLAHTFTKKQGKAMFLKGIYRTNSVSVLPAQESYRLTSFALANCLLFLDENTTTISAGELVEVHLLPHAQ